jgi:hypothetical protein
MKVRREEHWVIPRRIDLREFLRQPQLRRH